MACAFLVRNLHFTSFLIFVLEVYPLCRKIIAHTHCHPINAPTLSLIHSITQRTQSEKYFLIRQYEVSMHSDELGFAAFPFQEMSHDDVTVCETHSLVVCK